jgi:hypothetical protein
LPVAIAFIDGLIQYEVEGSLTMELRPPDDVRDVLVGRLFDGRRPAGVDDILYLGCGDGSLIEAVYQYCDQAVAATPPSGVVVDVDEERAEAVAGRYDEVSPRVGDYLHEEFVLKSSFDYILCAPPRRSWSELTREEQRAYATNFGHVTVDDDEVDTDLLFVTQAIRDLGLGGRAVFHTPSTTFDSESASTLRERHYYRIDAVDDLEPESYDDLEVPRRITTVTNDSEEWNSTTTKYEPSVYESALDTSIADVERPFTAAALMTSDLTGFVVDETVPKVYVDLMAADFDAAPVYDDPEERVKLRGYVSRERLRTVTNSTLGEQIKEFDSGVVVKPSDGIGEVIDKLRHTRFVFVFNDSLQGIITRFDLNKLPVYTHLYDCFSQFEIGLRELIRSQTPDWEERSDVRVPYRGQRNIVSDRLTCAEMSSLVEILRQVGLESELPRTNEVDLDSLVYLRNAIAHYNPIVHTMGERPTHDDPERGALQLAAEYDYLNSCISVLNRRE